MPGAMVGSGTRRGVPTSRRQEVRPTMPTSWSSPAPSSCTRRPSSPVPPCEPEGGRRSRRSSGATSATWRPRTCWPASRATCWGRHSRTASWPSTGPGDRRRPGDQPARRGRRLVLRAHRRPRRRRRHAVPRRLGDGRAGPPRPHHPPARATRSSSSGATPRAGCSTSSTPTPRRCRTATPSPSRGCSSRSTGSAPRPSAGDRRRAHRRPRRRARRGRGLAADVGAVRGGRPRPAHRPARRGRRRRGRDERALPRLARRPPLHLPRLPRVPARRRRRHPGGAGRRGARGGARVRAGDPARRPPGTPYGALARGPRHRARAARPRPHQGELARDRPPRRLPRLRRRADLRRAGPGDGGAALPRPAGLERLHGVDPRHPDPRRARPGGPAPRGVQPRQPLRQGPAPGHGVLPARRAAPDQRRRAARDLPGGAAAVRAAAHPLFLRPDVYGRFMSCLVYLRATATTPRSG